MPNHISNRLQILSFDEDWRKEQAAFEQLQAMMKTEDSPFDFNVLIPYPEPYKSMDDAHHAAEKALEGLPKEEYWQRWRDLPKDGYNQGGYEWCSKTWGTKWNAYEIGFGWDDVYFQTAWATPKGIWVELSKRFPDMRLEIEYADEDRGSNCGKLTYKNGELIAFDDMSARPEAELFARAIIAEQEAAAAVAELAELKAKTVS